MFAPRAPTGTSVVDGNTQSFLHYSMIIDVLFSYVMMMMMMMMLMLMRFFKTHSETPLSIAHAL